MFLLTFLKVLWWCSALSSLWLSQLEEFFISDTLFFVKFFFWYFPFCWNFLLIHAFFFPTFGTPLQYSCLENPMDGGAWWATVHGVAKSRTRLSDFNFPIDPFLLIVLIVPVSGSILLSGSVNCIISLRVIFHPVTCVSWDFLIKGWTLRVKSSRHWGNSIYY